ncbi:hypothetical protein EDB81DRAFT_814021 [Dactylonectria macrodidyma]|uniref:C2H2-type domain-containing protein n=1 Tax=Dactylonectria macrodidyma TaxID=307937 RepID=A0A9P9DLL7_9HYPO|nr:hypothetical protein EDB81DRAFT_814021 [Dactylonectria macrodidyma]
MDSNSPGPSKHPQQDGTIPPRPKTPLEPNPHFFGGNNSILHDTSPVDYMHTIFGFEPAVDTLLKSQNSVPALEPGRTICPKDLEIISHPNDGNASPLHLAIFPLSAGMESNKINDMTLADPQQGEYWFKGFGVNSYLDGGSVENEAFIHQGELHWAKSGEIETTQSNLKETKGSKPLRAPFFCDYPGCRGVGFSSSKNLRGHKNAMHRELSAGGPKYVCRYGQCGYSPRIWPRSDNFRSHLKRVHGLTLRSGDSDAIAKYIYRPSWDEPIPPPNQTPPIFYPLTHMEPHSNSHLFLDDTLDNTQNPDNVQSSKPPIEKFHQDNRLDHHLVFERFDEAEQVTSVFDTPEPLSKDGMALSADHEVRIKLSIPNNIEHGETRTPFTDSGYATLPNYDLIAKNQMINSKEQAQELVPGSSEDGQSAVLSAATSIMPSVAQQSISEVCKDIYYRIGDEIRNNTNNGAVTLDALPVLIKAFAIKLGTSPSTEMNRRMMHFVYKHHGRISQQLETMFHHATEDDFEGRSNTMGSMSLRDKMDLWNRSTDEPSKFGPSELFEGVDDEDEEDTNSDSEVLAYSKMIFSNTAYTWLIQNLLKQSTQYWDATQPRIMIDIVRRQILGNLPAERISKRRDPASYGATFWLPWQPLSERLMEERANQGAASIAEAVVLTASSVDQVQAITVKGYLDQTWSLDGDDLVIALQKAVNAKPGDVICVVQPNKLRIKVTVEESALIIHVVGSACFLAQCGEQLAWLGAALQPSRPGFVVHSTPSLTEVAIPRPGVASNPLSVLRFDSHFNTLDLLESQLSRRGFWEGLPRHQNWAIGVENMENDAPVILRKQLEGALAQPVIVRGFPTRRRPQLDLGLEVPATLLFSLADEFSQVADGKWPCLKGPSHTLSMVKKAGGMITWHITRSPGNSCSCRILPSPGRGITTQLIDDLAGLQHYRHIIEDCLGRKSTQTSAAIEACTQSPEEVCANPWESAALPRSTELDLSEPSVDSLDSDMLSISDDSNDKPETLWRPSDEAGIIITSAAQQLVSEFRRAETITSTNVPSFNLWDSTVPSDAPADGNSHHYSEGSRPTNDAPDPGPSGGNRQPQKRGHDNGDDDGDESNGNGNDPNQPPSKKYRPGPCESDPKMLACPFWKNDPEKFRQCFHLKLTEIKRVKQHLVRKHTPERYCTRCLTVFPSKGSFDHHSTQETCIRSEFARLEGISHDQHTKLRAKSNPVLSQSERWFVIWDVIFPNEPRPSSPYIPTGASEDLSRFLEFAQRRAASIMFQRLRASGIISSSDEEMSWVEQEILRQGFNDVYEQWLPTFPSLPGPATPTSTPRRHQPTRHETPGSVPDSAVALGSQTQPSESQFASSSTQGERLTVQQSYDVTGSLENATAPHRMPSFVEPISSNTFPGFDDNISAPAIELGINDMSGFEDFFTSTGDEIGLDWETVPLGNAG